ncbi:hypothetical protein B0H13DRAFT_1932604 [Mycena leptocephala]|nr:hypothetical protein B0H13DRAFT_1932604 [Mycena leptocephala]
MADSESDRESKFVEMLVGASANTEALGTVQDAAHTELSLSRVKFGKPAKQMLRITYDTMKVALVNYYNRHHPQVTLNAREVTPNTTPLLLHADVYDYALLDGRRSPQRHGLRVTMLVLLLFKQGLEPKHAQESPLKGGDDGYVWRKFPELGINTWEYQEYEDPGDADSKPLIIPLEDVQCQISRELLSTLTPYYG